MALITGTISEGNAGGNIAPQDRERKSDTGKLSLLDSFCVEGESTVITVISTFNAVINSQLNFRIWL